MYRAPNWRIAYCNYLDYLVNNLRDSIFLFPSLSLFIFIFLFLRSFKINRQFVNKIYCPRIFNYENNTRFQYNWVTR